MAMKQLVNRMWREDDGVLSFEWTVLTSLLTVGVVSGIAAVRDATIDEMGDLSQAMVSLDQSYYIQPPLAVQVHTGVFGGAGFVGTGFGGFGGFGFGGISGASDSGFVDAASYSDCYRGPHTKVQEFNRRSPPVNPGLEPAPGPVL
jgi:Flp pilus assembly pilin Flp